VIGGGAGAGRAVRGGGGTGWRFNVGGGDGGVVLKLVFRFSEGWR
jgi:hypothetical protein